MAIAQAGKDRMTNRGKTNGVETFVRFCLFSLLIFTPLARGSVQGWAVTVIHLVTLAALAAFFMDKISKWAWKSAWIGTTLDRPILLLSIIVVISTVFSLHRPTSAWSSLLFFDYIAWFYLTVQVIHRRTHLKQLIFLVLAVGVFLSVLGILKKFGVNPFPWWNYEDLRYSPDLVSSTFGNHNHFAGYLEMVIPLGLGLFLSRMSRVSALFLLFAVAFMTSAWILTLSRGGWASLTAGLLVMVILFVKDVFFVRKKIVVALFCLFLLTFVALLASTPVVERIQSLEQKQEVSTLKDRTTAWKGIYRMIQDHPAMGTGPGTFGTVFVQYQPPGFPFRYFNAHNDYLQFTAETGLLVLPVIAWMLLVQLSAGMRRLKHQSGLIRGAALGSLAGLSALLVHSFFDFNLHIPANALLFAVIAAIVHVRMTRSKEKKREAAENVRKAD